MTKKPDDRPAPPPFPGAGKCLWIEGDPAKLDMRFCGEPVGRVGAVWCPSHHKRVYTRTPEAAP